jgi:hypothetical protein
VNAVAGLLSDLLRMSLAGNERINIGRGSFGAAPEDDPLLGGIHPGAQLQDGPLGENATLGWGTAPEMVYPQPPVVPAANYAAAAHRRPPVVKHYPSPPLRHGTQHVAIAGPFGTAGPQLGAHIGDRGAGGAFHRPSPAAVAAALKAWGHLHGFPF